MFTRKELTALHKMMKKALPDMLYSKSGELSAELGGEEAFEQSTDNPVDKKESLKRISNLKQQLHDAD